MLYGQNQNIRLIRCPQLYGLHGQGAHQAIKIIIRTAGGISTLNNTTDIAEWISENFNKFTERIGPYLPPPFSAPYLWGRAKQEIKTTLDQNPELITAIKTKAEDLFDVVWNPIKGTSQLISWLPYILIGGLIIAVIFAFKNPSAVSTPRRVSVL